MSLLNRYFFLSVWTIRSQWCVLHVWTMRARRRSLRPCLLWVGSWSTPGLTSAPTWPCPLWKSPSRSQTDSCTVTRWLNAMCLSLNMCTMCFLFFLKTISALLCCCPIVKPEFFMEFSKAAQQKLPPPKAERYRTIHTDTMSGHTGTSASFSKGYI